MSDAGKKLLKRWQQYDPQANYEVRYESEDRSDSEEEFVENYPMCQPVAYDSEEYNSDQVSDP